MEGLLEWGREAQAALSSRGARFPALLRACRERLQPTPLAEAFEAALALHQAGTLDAALNLHLIALCEHCAAVIPAGGADEAAWRALCALLEHLAAALSERAMGILLQLAPTCVALSSSSSSSNSSSSGDGGSSSRVEELQAHAQACAQRALALEAALPPGAARLSFQAAKLCAHLQLGARRLAQGESLQLLRCAVHARHWHSVRFLLTEHFAPGEPGREAAFAQAMGDAGDGRFSSLLCALRGSTASAAAAAAAAEDGSSSGSGSSALPPAAVASAEVRASSALAVFKLRHPFKQHSAVPMHLAPPSHPHLLRSSSSSGGHGAASASASASASEELPASALVDLVAQGHARPPAELHAAHPPIALWKQRSLRHLVLVLRDVPLACSLALGDAAARQYLAHFLCSLGRAQEARSVMLAFGCSEEEAVRFCAAGSEGAGACVPAGGAPLASASAPASTAAAAAPGGEQLFWRVPLHFASSAARALLQPPPLPPQPPPTAPAYLVTLVASQAALSAMVAELQGLAAAASAPLALGLDTEHRPLASPAHPLSLLQLAACGRCWLVDLLALHAAAAEGVQGEGEGLGALGAFLRSGSCVCLGWGVREDLRRLQQSHARVFLQGGAPSQQPVLALDLAEVARALPACPTSLSAMVQAVLGAPLDKREQVSDWQLRPLSYAQLYYAALDAVSALALLQRLQRPGCPLAASAGAGLGECSYTFAWSCCAAGAAAGAAAAAAAPPPPPPLYPPHTYAPASAQGLALGPWDCAVALEALGLPPQRHLLWKAAGAAPAVGSGGGSGGDDAAAAAAAAAALPVKTLAVLLLGGGGGSAEPQPALLVLPKAARAGARGLPAQAPWRLASASECVGLFGYVPGCFPPLLGAYRQRMPVFLDCSVAQWGGAVVGGGGSPDHALRYASVAELVLGLGGGGEGSGWPVECALSEGGSAAAAAALTPPPLPPPLPPPAPAAASAEALVIPAPRLLCDSSLGRLTRWLRVIGVDAESRAGWNADRWLAARRRGSGETSGSGSSGSGGARPPPPMSSEELVEWANETRRIVLTRDAKVLAKRVASYFVANNDCAAQFVDVCDALGIRVRPEDLMARCAACNGLGYDELTAAQARERDTENVIPGKVLDKVPRFWGCRACPKVYWEGQKFDDTRDKYAGLFPQ